MKIAELKEKKIAILWFGREGKSTFQFLKKLGIHTITLLDTNTICIDESNVVCITGESYLDTLWEFDVIIKTPWISPFHEKIRPYRNKIISQTEIFFENYEGKVIGITGTKWKSTTSTLLFECLKEAGLSVRIVWNIGTPVLDEIDILWWSDEKYDYIVYELSSYMLQDFVPHLFIWIFNNIYVCHLDWHYNSWNIYKEAKLNILRNAEHQVIHGDFSMDSDIAALSKNPFYFHSKGKYKDRENALYLWEQKLISWEHIALPGEHNRHNIMAVVAVLDIIFWEFEVIQKILSAVLPRFHGLPHRIQDIGTYEGIRFIDDAIATTPESTMAAIETFEPTLQTLFLWGQDSGFQFKELRKKILQSSIENIIAFPDTATLIFPELESRDFEKAFEIEIEGKILQCIQTRSMKQGVIFAYKTTMPGRVALLSCWAPSFSLWKSYIHKADEYIAAVKGLKS